MNKEEKKMIWLKKNGFNSEGVTYIYFPSDSYDIKEELKQAGFRFSNILMWHCSEKVKQYADKVIEVKLNDIATMSAWGEGFFNPDAQKIIRTALENVRPHEVTSTDWVGEVSEKFEDLPVTFVNKRTMETRFGLTNLYTFVDDAGNLLNWWSASEKEFDKDEHIELSGTIKKLDEYKGNKITVVTRCKVRYL